MFILDEEEFSALLKEFSSGLAGKSYRRLEIAANINEAKSQIRELIYEETRALESKIKWLNKGKGPIKIVFEKEKDNGV